MPITNINTGINPNDGLGDSIRDAFIKVNSNFDFLEAARVAFASNLSTGNLSVSNTFTANGTGDITGFFTYNGIEIATVGTTFSGGFVANPTTFQNTNDAISGNLTSGGLVVLGGASVNKILQANIFLAGSGTFANTVQAGTLYTLGNANVANVNATGIGVFNSNLRTNAFLAVNNSATIGGNASVTGNVSAGNVNITNFMTIGGNLRSTGNINTTGNISGNFITGTLTTNIQPSITQVGTLSNLVVSGNLTVNNASSTAFLFGNVGIFDRLQVTNLPDVATDVANKDYVDITAVAFGIALS
jgi:hypothetical protein